LLSKMKRAIVATGIGVSLRTWYWAARDLREPGSLARFTAKLRPGSDQAKNARYDRETVEVLGRILSLDSNCIDVGAHEGAILRRLVELAPRGKHFAFEPLPMQAARLREHFPGATVCEVALSDSSGTTTFQHVVSRPGYSGLRRREYPRLDERVETIVVHTTTLDATVPETLPVTFVKIDVEGAELLVLRGAVKTLTRWLPYVVFEHGLGAADHYGTRPEEVYDLFRACGLRVSLMSDWLARRDALTRRQFARQFDRKLNFYFLAHPDRASSTSRDHPIRNALQAE
jgi:FkbM family methyltransferase